MQYTVKQTFYFQGKLWPAGNPIEVNEHLSVELLELGFLEAAKPAAAAAPQPSFAARLGRSKQVPA